MIEKITEKIENSKLFQSKLLQSSFVRQFIKFGIIGLSNTILSYVLYLVFLKLFEKFGFFPNYDYIVSSVLTFCICSVWSFYWNNRFTFKKTEGEERNILKTFIKTVMCYSLTGLLLNNAMLYLLVEFCGLAKEIVPLLILVVTVPLNFLLNKYWAFGKKE